MINAQNLLVEYAGEALTSGDLQADDISFRVEIGDDPIEGADLTADLIFVERLQFHSEYVGNRWAGLVDEDGYLTKEAASATVEELKRLILEASGVEADIEHADYAELEDEASFAVSIRTTYAPGETVAQWFDRAWPFVATFINVTDPGTNNSPYLFTQVG